MSHDLEKFKQIYFETFEEHLSDEEVERKARLLVNLYLAVYRSPAEAADKESADIKKQI